MAYLYGSGNKTVDQMINFGITGNVVSHAWYKTILRENGKPHLLAISILSDIVYWYRPQEIRDENTGHLLRYQKRFSGEMLQKSYESYSDFFGESKRTIKQAMDVLVNLGVVKRQFRSVSGGGMTTYSNVMFLDLDIRRLHEITNPETDTNVDNLSTDEDEIDLSTIGKMQKYPQVDNENSGKAAENKAFEGSYKISYPLVQNNVPPGTKFCTTPYEKKNHPLQNNVPPGTEFGNTYTEEYREITTENTAERNSPYHHYLLTHTREQLMKHLEVKIRNQIGFEELTQQYSYAAKALVEAVKKISEALATETDPVVINGKKYPYSLASMRFASATEHTFRTALQSIRIGVDRKEAMVNKLFSAPLHYPSK